MKNPKISPAVKIALIYFVSGSLWILLSDQVVNYFYPAEDYVFRINISKGLVFVFLTSIVLFFSTKTYLAKVSKESRSRELTEAELRKEKHLLNRVTDTSPVAITILDTAGQITYANNFAEKLFNLSKSKIKKRKYDSPQWKITDLEGNKISSDQLPFQIVLKTQQPVYDVCHAIELSNGEKIYLSINASPLLDDKSGELLGIVAVMRNITGRIRMEEELRRGERKYRLLFESNPQPMWVYDLDTLNFIDVNKAAVDKYGYTKGEFLSMSIRDIRPPEEVDKLEKFIEGRESKEYALSENIIWKHKLKNGKTIHVKILSHNIELEDKLCRIVLAHDVTENITYENALKRSEQRYKRIFENIVDVYFETAIDGTIIEISPSVYLLSYGSYKREDLIGKSIISLYHNTSERTGYIKQLLKYKRLDDYEVQLVNKDGRIVYCSITAKLTTEDDTQRIVGSLRDISVRKNYEDDLIKAKEIAENADRLKGEFLAQMSHEIRTPLNIILNSSNLIRDELTGQQVENLGEIFQVLNSSGKRIIRTIDLILNMSEIQTGTYEPEFTEIAITKDILFPIVKEYEIIAKEKGLTLQLESVNEKTFFISADRYSVSQIFANLIDNAIKYTKKGKVTLKVTGDDEKISVEVKDTGIGISQEFIPHLFEAFRQEYQGYSRMFEGNGLGLALVKKFCELNHAIIKVDSKLDEGSTFTVDFNQIKNKNQPSPNQ